MPLLQQPSSGEFPLLFSPLQIGPVRSRNRIVFGAHFDAVAVRWADRAIFDGHMAGRSL